MLAGWYVRLLHLRVSNFLWDSDNVQMKWLSHDYCDYGFMRKGNLNCSEDSTKVSLSKKWSQVLKKLQKCIACEQTVSENGWWKRGCRDDTMKTIDRQVNDTSSNIKKYTAVHIYSRYETKFTKLSGSCVLNHAFALRSPSTEATWNACATR